MTATMIRNGNDPLLKRAMEKLLFKSSESGIVMEICDICGAAIFEEDECFSNGEMWLCSECYRDFEKV